jgi:hypothetical protein
VILKALDKEPEGRFASAGDLARALGAAISGISVTPRPVPQPARAGQPAPKRLPAWSWAAGCLLALILLVGAVLLIWGLRAIGKRLPARADATLSASQPALRFTPADTRPPVFSVTPAIPDEPAATLTPAIPLTPATFTPEVFFAPPPENAGDSGEAGGSDSATPPAPQPVTGFLLPISDPYDIIALPDGTLQVLYDQKLVTVELVEAEGRFKAGEQRNFTLANSLEWDASLGLYWAVYGTPHLVDRQIDQVSAAGELLVAYGLPEAFDRYPRHLAWDGQSLWVDNEEGTLYQLQAVKGSSELQLIDSYALSVSLYGSNRGAGLVWDGAGLWLLLGDKIFKLEQGTQATCSIQLSTSFTAPAWYEWRGLAWDGQFLWALHSGENKAYRVDPQACE